MPLGHAYVPRVSTKPNKIAWLLTQPDLVAELQPGTTQATRDGAMREAVRRMKSVGLLAKSTYWKDTLASIRLRGL